MPNKLFQKELLDKSIFNIKDLDGKSVTLRVAESEGWQYLYAIEGDHLYLIQENNIQK